MKWRLYREKLLWLRINRGWSQEEAAFQCEAPDKKTWHLWETGKTERPRKRNLEKICSGFEIDDVEEIMLQPNQRPAPELEIFYNAHYGLSTPGDATSPLARKQGPFKLICFDLDATLIQGLDFSWKAVWAFLDDDEKRRQGLRLYHTGKLNYEEWCLWCCEIFKTRGLTENDIEKIASNYKIANNLYAGLKQLKQEGYTLAIISGGIYKFLTTLIPDYKDYFDYVFINKFSFDKDDCVKHIIPTPFDFDQKPEGIRYISSMLGIDPRESIFVGSTFVDKFVIDTAGLSIGYANPSDEIVELFDEQIDGDDFLAVVDLITYYARQEPH